MTGEAGKFLLEKCFLQIKFKILYNFKSPWILNKIKPIRFLSQNDPQTYFQVLDKIG